MINILDRSCISPQHTFGSLPFEKGVISHEGNKYYAIEPDYKDIISRGNLRRMGKISRLGVGAGFPLLQKYPVLNGIIIGTSNGSMENCVKFLDQIIKYEEGTLTPTNFVMSTSNAVAGALALLSQNTTYNSTYVSIGLAFESALLDAMMLIEEEKGGKYLVGCTEELSDYNYNIDKHRGLFKTHPVSSKALLKSQTLGSVSGEGATMFVMSDKPENHLAIVHDVSMIQTRKFTELETALFYFLEKNNLKTKDIDTLIVGFNGDMEGDRFYHGLLENSFKTQSVLSFKNMVGESGSVTGFALWLACQQNQIPKEAIFRKGKNRGGKILIYNHFNGVSHGFILVSNPKLSMV